MRKRRDPGAGPDELDADLVSTWDPDDPRAWTDEPHGTDDTDGIDETAERGAPPAPRVAPLRDELDLHTFAPRECAGLVDEYLLAARAAGFTRVRIVHGKGTGALRRTVHGVLDRHPAVRAYRLADERAGGWGATLVELVP